MSRHRDFHNMDAEEFEDDLDSYGSSYGSSYVEETSLSTSVERDYMYRRTGGHTPKMGHFVMERSNSVPSVPEEEELEGEMRARSDSETSSGSNNFDDLDQENKLKLAHCLEEILDIVGDTLPEQLVKEAIVRCDYDKEVALNTLLNNPVGHRGGQKPTGPDQQQQQRPNREMPNRDIPNSSNPSNSRTEPKAIGGRSSRPVISEFSSAAKPIKITESGPSQMDYENLPTLKTSAAASKPPEKPIQISESNTSLVDYTNLPTLNTSTTSSASKPARPIQISESNTSLVDYANLPTVNTSTMLNNKNILNVQQQRDRSRSQSPGQIPPSSSSVSLASMSGVQMRKAKVDVINEYKNKRGGEKDLLNMVVVGHVDSGKSTLMGHLLFKLGSVNSKTMHKYEQESKKLGKQSFCYAWVLDETAEERERGITMDVGQNKFETNTKQVTLLDAPGHKDFIPNMISGAYQADVAILVVNSTRGEFEAGFESGGQTREHALLVRSLGVSQLIVAVNKMDTVSFNEERYRDIVKKLKTFLKQVGFRDSEVSYVPCSGFTGEMLIQRNPDLAQWYQGPTLIESIDAFKPPERLIEKPFRISISDIFKPQNSGFCISGRIESGFVQKEDKVLISPLNEVANVKNLMIDEMPHNIAFAGDHVTIGLLGPDMSQVANGMIVCDPSQPIPVSKHIRARIVVFNIDIPLTKGYPAIFHYGSVQVQASIKKLVAEINKSNGEITKRKPRCLSKNCNAIIELSLENAICIELYSNIKELGRFMLRSGGKTIAAGLVTDVL